MSTIYLRPLNGLCNRLRALASARALAAATGARLVVFWDVNVDVGARYDDLFRPAEDGFELINVSREASPRQIASAVLFGETPRLKGIPLGWVTGLVLRNRIHRNLRPETFTPDELEDLVSQSGQMLITSWWAFYREAHVDFSFFQPHSSEQAEIDAVAAQFNDRTIGLHIRRSDNQAAIRYSPTSAFESAMESAIAGAPKTQFYLSTDCLKTEALICERFGNRVITRQRNLQRDSASGMKDAIVDLFCLSRTTVVWGCYYSTFSQTAASIGNINWYTVTDDPGLVGNCKAEVLLVPKAS